MGADHTGRIVKRIAGRAESESLDASLQRGAHLHDQRPAGNAPIASINRHANDVLAADVIVINHTLLFMLLGDSEEQEDAEIGYPFPKRFHHFR